MNKNNISQREKSKQIKKEKYDIKDDTLNIVNDEIKEYIKDNLSPDNDKNDIDYVLVYSKKKHVNDRVDARRRSIFQHNLKYQGIKIEEITGIKDKSLVFVLISVSEELLIHYADNMKMKMPLKADLIEPPVTFTERLSKLRPSQLCLPEPLKEHRKKPYLTLFRADRIERFNLMSDDGFMSKSKRSLIALEILQRTPWGFEKNETGIDSLLSVGVYWAHYSLHEGKAVTNEKDFNNLTKRQVLWKYWARPGAVLLPQPMDSIRDYFGEKIAIYFAWLGFYTNYLVPAAVVGLIIFIYNLCKFGSNSMSHEVCNETIAGGILMCPSCDRKCDYWKLQDICLWVKIGKIFDNDFTIFFAVFMSGWAAMYHRSWKNKEMDLKYEWSTYDFMEIENVRTQFEENCKTKRRNYITGEPEGYMRVRDKFPRVMASVSSVLVMVGAVVGALIGTMAFRITIGNMLASSEWSEYQSMAKLVISSGAAVINLSVILILDFVYRTIAIWLTELENPRTESQFDDSLTLKMYIFAFFNFYSSLFYIAFFKGRFIGRPGDYNKIFNQRQEECDPAGCLVSLSIQMIIIFVGKQIANNLMEIILPLIKPRIQGVLLRFKMKKRQLETIISRRLGKKSTINQPFKYINQSNYQYLQWEKDYKLVDCDQLDLFDEYREMVIQYGFVTMFSAIMPLAPLFALLNNIIEIRLDAYKMLVFWRRPKAKMTNGIGIWDEILLIVTRISIVTNGFLVSFTSNAIPELIFLYGTARKSHYMDGFIQFSLSKFNVSDFEPNTAPQNTKYPNITICSYQDYRNPPGSPNEYEFSITYWYILAARLAFVIVFEHTTFAIMNVIQWSVPKYSSLVMFHREQETYLQNKLLLEAVEMKGKMSMSNMMTKAAAIETLDQSTTEITQEPSSETLTTIVE